MNEKRYVTEESLKRFKIFLQDEERSAGTIEKYMRDVRNFAVWLRHQDAANQFQDVTVPVCEPAAHPCEVTKETAIQWKQFLLQSGRAPATINSMLAAVNTYFKFMGWSDIPIKAIRLQKSFFRSSNRELTKAEYERLVAAAHRKGDEQLALLMKTICAPGIRVSEVKYITWQAIKTGKAQISLKGKLRTILIPQQLCRKLRKYAKRKGIGFGGKSRLCESSGSCEIFLTSSGRRLDRRQIWAKMKALCRMAGVAREKVFPHNLRHLFARCFYRASRDLSALANMLGHSSIETTRIYLVSTEDIYAKKIARLGLVQTK